MEIVLIRTEHKPWGVDGKLYINRRRVCDTVEHPSYCKPKGTYDISLETNPFRHGDGAMKSVKGEIIVGQQLLSGIVTESQMTYDRLYERLKKAWQRGREVQLSIYG